MQAEKAEAENKAVEAKAKVEELTGHRIAPVPFEQTEIYATLTAQIAEIQAKIADEGKCTTEAVSAVETKIRATSDAIREEQDKRMQLTMAENQRRRIGELLLQKEKRTSNAATLEVSGRDQQDQKLYLNRNTETLLWELERRETELWKEPPDPLLEKLL